MNANITCRLALAMLALSTAPLTAHAQATPNATAYPMPVFQQWMHPDLPLAWKNGFRGQGVNVTIIDTWEGNTPGDPEDDYSHGALVTATLKSVAPSASVGLRSLYDDASAIGFSKPGLNVFNVSFGLSTTRLAPLHQSIVDAARRGKAVVVAAAGNSGVDMRFGGNWGDGSILQKSLIGAQSVIFVGALSKNGGTKPGTKASRASYSNKAGDEAVARQFVMVGVDETKGIPLDGTSAAAPIVSGYAAIIGSKFKTATPKQVTWQILNTARIDTIKDYTRSIHGRGEASLSRALAPVAIK